MLVCNRLFQHLTFQLYRLGLKSLLAREKSRGSRLVELVHWLLGQHSGQHSCALRDYLLVGILQRSYRSKRLVLGVHQLLGKRAFIQLFLQRLGHGSHGLTEKER